MEKKLNFNGGWSMGEASHHTSKRMTQQTIPSAKIFSRKKKHRNLDD